MQRPTRRSGTRPTRSATTRSACPDAVDSAGSRSGRSTEGCRHYLMRRSCRPGASGLHLLRTESSRSLRVRRGPSRPPIVLPRGGGMEDAKRRPGDMRLRPHGAETSVHRRAEPGRVPTGTLRMPWGGCSESSRSHSGPPSSGSTRTASTRSSSPCPCVRVTACTCTTSLAWRSWPRVWSCCGSCLDPCLDLPDDPTQVVRRRWRRVYCSQSGR